MGLSSSPAPAPLEELDLSAREVWNSYPKICQALSEDARELLMKDHMPVLQRFSQLVMGKPKDGFASILSGLPLQL